MEAEGSSRSRVSRSGSAITAGEAARFSCSTASSLTTAMQHQSIISHSVPGEARIAYGLLRGLHKPAVSVIVFPVKKPHTATQKEHKEYIGDIPVMHCPANHEEAEQRDHISRTIPAHPLAQTAPIGDGKKDREEQSQPQDPNGDPMPHSADDPEHIDTSRHPCRPCPLI